MKGCKILILILVLTIFASCLKRENSKIFILGLDGATWKVIDKMIEKGKLPTFKKLMEEGSYGALRTIRPTVSVIIWTSIATGVLPAKHGIWNWTVSKIDKIGGQTSITSNHRKRPAIWNITSYYGKTNLIVNYWASWPAEKINGIMISNRINFKELSDRYYPPDLKIEPIKINYSNEELLYPLSKKLKIRRNLNLEKVSVYWSKILGKELYLSELGKKLFFKNKPDLTILYFRTIDVLEHQFWHTIEPEKFKNKKKVKPYNRNIIQRYYEYYDYYLKEIMNKMTKNDYVVVVSDHGMEAIEKYPPPHEGFRLNDFLKAFDLLKVDSRNYVDKVRSYAIDSGKFPPSLKRSLYLFDKGMQKINELINFFKELKTIEGNRIFKKVYRSKNNKREIILELNPEFDVNEGIEIKGEIVKFKKFISYFLHPNSGQHWFAPRGIFLIKGPGIKKNYKIKEITILDILPTLLYIMDLPISKFFDGKIAKEIFDKDYLKNKNPKFIKDYYWYKKFKKDFRTVESVEKEEIEELKALGYLAQ